MCIAPTILEDGSQVACRQCWQCIENKVNDYVGRNIAENLTATYTHYVTLTYGRVQNEEHHARSLLLTYSDVQKLLKLLRFYGFEVRYLVAGEFGSKNGRAHWHIILHWQGALPAGIKLNDPFFMWARLDPETGEQARDVNGDPAFFWPHGFAHFQEATHEAVRYCCKYIQKDLKDDKAQAELHYSLKPPLGFKYFCELAERHVANKLAPQTLFYSFPNVTKRKRGTMDTFEPVEFMLQGKMAEKYIQHYIDTWRRAWPELRHTPPSPVVDAWLDYGKLREPNLKNQLTHEKFESNLRARAKQLDKPPKPKGEQLYSWQRGKVVWNAGLQCWEAPGKPGTDSVWYWAYLPAKGRWGWRPALFRRTEHGVEKV